MQRTRWTAVGWSAPARMSVAITATLAMVLAGCGGDDPDAVEIDEAGVEDVEDVEDEPAPEEEPEPDVAGDQESEQEDATVDPETEDEGTAEADDGPMAAPTCDLAATSGGTQLGADAYEQVVLETNFELELLVMDISADLDELLSGVSDGATLDAQLLGHQERYAEATAEVADVQPPDGAEAWHERAMGSFDSVCGAIADGLAGSAAGDDDRFDDFVEALTEFPSVLNELHANAACGPFEDC